MLLSIILACASSDSVPSNSTPLLAVGGSTADAVNEDTGNEDTGTGDTNETAQGDTGGDTAVVEDTAQGDTAQGDTGVEDTAIDPSGEDTAPACTGLTIDSTGVSGTAHGYGSSMYSSFSKTFHITGCATNVTAHNGCSGDGSSWFDISWPGSTEAATTSGGCVYGGRDETLLDDSGMVVTGEVDTEVTLTVIGYGYIDSAAWAETTIDSDQGTLTVRVDFD